MSKVTVRLTTSQTLDGTTEQTVVESIGTLEKSDGGWLLTYAEPKNEDSYGADVRMTVQVNSALIERKGPISAHMPLVVQRDTVWQYDTPYGTMDIPVRCDKMDNQLTATGGRFSAAYIVSTPGDPSGMACTMEILVKDVQE